MQLYFREGFSLPTQASFFLICTGDSTGAGFQPRFMPNPVVVVVVVVVVVAATAAAASAGIAVAVVVCGGGDR